MTPRAYIVFVEGPLGGYRWDMLWVQQWPLQGGVFVLRAWVVPEDCEGFAFDALVRMAKDGALERAVAA